MVKQEGGGGVKRPLSTTRANVCWQFNDGSCHLGHLSSFLTSVKCVVVLMGG